MLTEPQKTMLTHQTLAVRVYARAYLYQIGGAYGFRDQLQDCMNLIDRDPGLLRRQIYRCAAAQFPEAVLKAAMLELIDADYWLKTGQAGEEILEHTVIRLCDKS